MSFEVLMVLARIARAGHDVGALLTETVEANLGELAKVTEFQVAMGTIPRPAGAVVPWILDGAQ